MEMVFKDGMACYEEDGVRGYIDELDIADFLHNKFGIEYEEMDIEGVFDDLCEKYQNDIYDYFYNAGMEEIENNKTAFGQV